MIYKCKECGFSESRGVLPQTTCGLLLAIYIGISIGLIMTIVPRVFPDGLGWWWLIGGPVVFTVAVLMSFVLSLLFETIEWLVFCRRKCPICEKRRWSWGFTQGFGL